MSEHLEAQALADWLAGTPNGAVPETLDADVAEAIIALRPEYAPPHTVSIESVLATLTEGPLVDPAIAEALRQWLESKPGTPPPATLPVGVVEATYALRPDLAPSLGINIDDVLNEVSSGPLAEAEVIPLPAKTGPAKTGPAKTSQIASRALGSTRRKWWTGTAVTATAVAATTLLFVGPMADKAHQGPSHFTDGRVAQATAMEKEEHPIKMMEAEDALTESIEHEVKAVESAPTLEFAPPKAPTPRSRATRRLESARTRTPDATVAADVTAGAAPTARSAPPPAVLAESMPERIQSHSAAADGERPILLGAAPDEHRDIAPGVMGVADNAADDAGSFGEEFEDPAPEAYAAKTQIDFEGLDLDQAGGTTARSAPEPKRSGRRGSSRAQAQEHSAAEVRNDAASSPRTRGDVAALQALQAGQRLLDAGEFDRALRKVESGLRSTKRDPILTARLLRLKATILSKLGRETEAKQAREEAAKVDPLR